MVLGVSLPKIATSVFTRVPKATKKALERIKPFPAEFPYDIIYLIVCFTESQSHQDLRTLCLVSRWMLEMIEPWLWQDVRIEIKDNQPYRQVDNKLDALLRREQRTSSLRHLHLILDSTLAPSFSINSFQGRVERILSLARHIQSLEIQDPHHQLHIHRSLALELPNAHPVLLTKLTYHDRVTSEFWNCLRTQNNLRVLELTSNTSPALPTNDQLHSGDLASLECLAAPAKLLPLLSFGRSIKYISMIGILDDHNLDLLTVSILTTSSPVESLAVRPWRSATFRLFLASLSETATSLRFLSVAWLCRWEVNLLPISDLVPLSKLENLECIRWRGRLEDVDPIRLASGRWHPAIYAGPALRIVQHETNPTQSYLIQRESEQSVWQRDENHLSNWRMLPGKFIAPRMDLLDRGMDPLGFLYIGQGKPRYGNLLTEE